MVKTVSPSEEETHLLREQNFENQANLEDSNTQEGIKEALIAFDIFDLDKNGYIDLHEFIKLVNYPGLQSDSQKKLTDEQIKMAFDWIDVSKEGNISKEEFYRWYSSNKKSTCVNPPLLTRQLTQMRNITQNIRSATFFENFRRLGTKPTYYCILCLENKVIDDRKTSICLSSCYHRYCIQCLTEYLIHSVNNGSVYPVCHCIDSKTRKTCGVKLWEDDILELLPESSKKKYSKFKANKDNQNNRQCPKCQHTQLGNIENVEMVCKNCGMKYCFKHGNAHQNEDCATFERKHYQEEKQSNVIIKKNCKPCPKCEAPINKNGGCNHMKCAQCECSFCWICMKQIDDKPVPDHYKFDPTNPGNSCVGRQMEGINRAEALAGNLTGIRRCFFNFVLYIFFIIFLLVACPIGFAMTIVYIVLSPFASGSLEVCLGSSMCICMLLGCVTGVPCLLCCMSFCGCIPSSTEEEEEDHWIDNLPQV